LRLDLSRSAESVDDRRKEQLESCALAIWGAAVLRFYTYTSRFEQKYFAEIFWGL